MSATGDSADRGDIAHRGATPQQRASDPESSAWVSANAGSGKTHVLVARAIRLLLGGTAPERILCITYTKAAAAEMANRLSETLGRWAFAGDDELAGELAAMAGERPGKKTLNEARRLFARALETPGGLKILTIHGFCESVLQRFPLEAGIHAGFDVLDEPTARELQHEARANLMLEAARDPDGEIARHLETLNLHLSEGGFAELVGHYVSHRDAVKETIRDYGEDGETLRRRIAASLGGGEADEAGIVEAAVGDKALDRNMLRRWLALALEGARSDKATAENIAAALAAKTPGERYEPVLDLYMTSTLFGATRKQAARLMTKAVAEADPELAAWAAAEQARLWALYETHKAAIVARASAAILTLADHVITAYEAQKHARAMLDYDDLIDITRELLRSSDAAAWVLFKLDGGLDHILIDEAQDTSPAQWQIVERLADDFFAGEAAHDTRRTIFAVGDEKQSIFSFQGARPEEFAAMRRWFEAEVRAAGQAFAPVPLTVSWRSTQTVLDGVDRVFANPAAADGLMAEGGEIVHQAVRARQTGRIEIWPPERPDEQLERQPWTAPVDYESPVSAHVRLAGRIAGTIAGWLDNGEFLPGRARPVRPGDILILVRRRNSFVDAMIRALKACDIPVAGADRMVLSEQIAVMDLIALGRFVLLPEDELNLASLLKSPLIGFDDDDLFALADGREGTLWAVLAGDERDRFRAAADRLKGWAAAADFSPPYAFFARILECEDGRKAMRARLGPEAEDAINEFLALALDYEQHGAPSLQGFLAWLAAGSAEIKRDMDHGADEVRIMTVHGAKGLEANIVFLPDSCAVPRGNDPALMFIPAAGSPGNDLSGVPVWALTRGYETAPVAAQREELKAARIREYHRLLYVAMTRASDRLYVCGYETRNGRDEDCWYDLIHDALIPGAREMEYDGRTVWRIEDEGDDSKSDLAEPPDGGHAPLDAALFAEALPSEGPRFALIAPSRLAAESGGGPTPDPHGEALSPLAAGGADRFRRGRLIHALFQYLPDIAPEERRGRASAWLARPGHALEPDEQREIEQAVMAVMEDAQFAHLFAPGSMAEVPVAGEIGAGRAGEDARHVMGVIDRLVVTDTTVLIADFKTNRPAPQSLEAVPRAYVAQMAAYAQVLGKVYPDKQVACALAWTDGPKMMVLPDAMLDAALPGL